MRSRDIKRRHGIHKRRFLKLTSGLNLPRVNFRAIRLPILGRMFVNRRAPGKSSGKSAIGAGAEWGRHSSRSALSKGRGLGVAGLLYGSAAMASRSRGRTMPIGAMLKEWMLRICVVAIIVVALITVWRVVRPGVNVRPSPDTVAAFRVPHRAITALVGYADSHGVPFPEVFAVFNAQHQFFPDAVHDNFDIEELELYVINFDRLRRNYNNRSLEPYIQLYHTLFSELEVFPIPSGWYMYDASIMFGNSWGVGHNFQGTDTHMGTAIIDRENIRGRVPVVSMTRGVIESAGFDRQLGYFVKVVTDSGTQYLYAHLDSLAANITPGQGVVAGQHLGQMGNSGGGRDSRSFPVHLHIAISPSVSFVRRQFWINPYPLLMYLEGRGE